MGDLVVSVLFENDDIVAVGKPEGLAVIPERNRTAGSLLELLSARRGERLYVVHRIDKETSGVVVFARNARAHRWLNRQFQERNVEKTYLALVHGQVVDSKGFIDRPLRQFGSGRVGVDPDRGKACLTEFRVRQRFNSFTLLEAAPRTGRRHQIRVHLYSLGHPIAGDLLYGDKTIQRSIPRLMLHAQKLILPFSPEGAVTIEASLPDSFRAILNVVARS